MGLSAYGVRLLTCVKWLVNQS